MFKTSEQMATGKRINRPSDDIDGYQQALALKSTLDRVSQYERNLNQGERLLKHAETALSSVHDVLKRAKELALQGRNGTLSQDERTAIAEEVQQLQQQVLNLANTQIDGEYIFSGYRSNTKPYALDNAQPNADPVATYSGDSNIRTVQINDSTTLDVQVRGDQTFQGDGTAATVDIFQTLADLESSLRSGNLDETSATGVPQMIDDVQTAMNQVINQVTSIGARSNRIEAARSHFDVQKETIQSFLEDIETADPYETIMEFQKATTALQSTVNAASIVLNQPSLLQFIK